MPDFEDMTDAELDQPATRRDVRELRTDVDTKLGELRADFDARFGELRRHFDVVAESFRADFANLFDWTQSTTSTMGTRIDGLDSRVTRLERRRKN